jgi:hypothetical protein
MAKNQHLLISQHISDKSFPDCTKPRFPGAPTKTLKAATRKILTSKRHTHNHIHECAFLSIQQFIPPLPPSPPPPPTPSIDFFCMLQAERGQGPLRDAACCSRRRQHTKGSAREGGRGGGRQRGGWVHRQRRMPRQTYVAVRRRLARERSGVFLFLANCLFRK